MDCHFNQKEVFYKKLVGETSQKFDYWTQKCSGKNLSLACRLIPKLLHFHMFMSASVIFSKNYTTTTVQHGDFQQKVF